MIIIHAALVGGRLLFWGESPPTETARPSRRRAKGPPGLALPFDAGQEALVGALQQTGLDLIASAVKPITATLWLPTIDGRPTPSSSLIEPSVASAAEATLAPWTVTAVAVPIDRVLELLARALDQAVIVPGVLVGSTAAYWSAAARFAGALVAQQQFLPDVQRQSGKWRACWRTALSAADRQRLGSLARAMPAACRAVSETEDAPDARPAAAVLGEFVDAVVDALVRGAAAPPLVAIPGRLRKARTGFDSIHDQWLHALRTGDGTLRGAQAELTKLAEEVQSWQRPLQASSASAFRLCFRLEEPPPATNGSTVRSGNRWTVRYLLQAQDDPSLLVPAEDAWKPRGRHAALLQRQGFRPREYLLAALGQAAALCPGVETSLLQPAPAEFDLDTTEANQFLTQQSWLLEQAGFAVLLPAWWTRKGTKQRLTVSAQVKSPPMQGGAGMSLDEIVQFDWRVALGDQVLTLQELETLARLKAPLVQVRGQWVQVNAEEIQAALQFWKNQKTKTGNVRDVVLMALGAKPAPGGLAVGNMRATGWVGELLDQLQGQASFQELPPPQGLHGTLRPYQTRGYSWLAFLRRWGLGACLADDMGLGKTVQTLALIQLDWERNGSRPVLLICPVSVVGNWLKEAERFTPDLPVLVHHGLKRTRSKAFAKEAQEHAIVVSSYALIHRDLAHLQDVSWAGVILDEAQNIKNPNTKQAQAARALSADYKIALTGTPVENHVGDLWSIWQFLNPGFLGGETEFRRRFFVPIQLQRDADAAERLRRLTGPFLLRRLKTDKSVVSDLPEKLEMKVYCNLTREQTSLYAAVVNDLERTLKGTEGIQRRGAILALLSKLKQVCNHPAQFLGDNSSIPGRSGKLARLTEMLEEVIEAGDRALVFTQFTEMGGILQKHLQESFGREVLFLHGGLTRKQRDQMVARFQQAQHAPPIFLLSLKAGGTGLNLTAATHVFHFDRWWNPAIENQATDRAFRIGQTRNVQVHKFVCVGTLEEKIDEMIERKQGVAAQVVGSGEAWLTELSNDQLKDLFALRQEALGE
jgi:SNF2 family DNA or RNA helicase